MLFKILLLKIIAFLVREQLLLASDLSLQTAKSLTIQMKLVMADIKALSQGVSNIGHIT